ncbi:glycosyltransferase [Algisphaera agarilytica]|uniref:Glycosyltransferase involved in cell wall biosynthesis n=1 Tax=Algisphaera agarilytica TaxID=1385975 RepID=A0A7X0LK70_9BACT|nr:glycosyltransferase [Algisphaera agarilytica]MBB6430125.1 glycosyltransferase involved in cell wall biosynthesis [Algisphaera agarilytica]
MRVALVHESITGFHGSERVLESLARLYPDAPIFVLIHHPSATRGTALEGRDIRTSVLDRLPWLRNRHRILLPFMPYAVEQHDLRGFDVVISSHHAAAHGVLTRADQLHLCYTHSPARYAWDLYHDHVPPHKFSPIKRAVMHRFRQWDALAGQRVDEFAANSKHVAARIRKTYRRDATVIYPPVDTARFRADRDREDFYLVAGRLVKYKNVDVVLESFMRTGKRLVVVGDGSDRKKLEVLAGKRNHGYFMTRRRRFQREELEQRGALAESPRIEFVGELKEAAFADRLERCRALLFAGEEDFGMVPVEAMAAGAPVIALRRGGLTETVEDGVTGVFFDEPTPEAVTEAVQKFENQGVTAGPGELQCSAQRFAVPRFERQIQDWVSGAWQRFIEQ